MINVVRSKPWSHKVRDVNTNIGQTKPPRLRLKVIYNKKEKKVEKKRDKREYRRGEKINKEKETKWIKKENEKVNSHG